VSSRQHFRKIDFVRGIAILAIFQAHFIWYYFPGYAGIANPGDVHAAKRMLLLNILPRTIGWAGVTLFILVSGFLLHLGYLKTGSKFSLRVFYTRRFWRVYPPYLLALLAFSLFLEKDIFTTRVGWLSFLLHVFSMQNLSNRYYFSVNPTFWCLALEVQLYIFYAVFLYGRKRWGIKKMVGLCFLVSLVWQTFVGHVDSLANSLPWTNSVLALWVIWTAGAFLGEAWQDGRSLIGALNRRDFAFILGGLTLAILLAPLNALLQYAAGIIGVLLMDLFLQARQYRLQNKPARLLVTIGLCSYSIFLIHQPLIRVFVDFLDLHSPRYPGFRVVDGGIAALFIFGLSWGMYRLVELPSIAMGHRAKATPSPERLHQQR
jgi:peptidoglycan/LPS O-acetylase OafA/YrhL